MDRVDLYGVIHKGLRAALFDGAETVARTDFTQEPECAGTIAALRHLLGFLDEHAEHEDAKVMPEVRRCAPNVFAELETDHTRVAALQFEIRKLLDRLPGAPVLERVSLGRRLHERMGRLVAEQLQHMEREEVTANRVLWAHHSDPELLEIHRRIVTSIPPRRMQEWATILLPALSAPERDMLLGGLRASMSPADFAPIAALNEVALSA